MLSTITASVPPLSLPCLGDGEQRDVVSGLLNGYPQGEMTQIHNCLTDTSVSLFLSALKFSMPQRSKRTLSSRFPLCPPTRYWLRLSSKMPELHWVPSPTPCPLKWHSHSHPCFAVCSLPGWPDRGFQVAPPWNTSRKVAQGTCISRLLNKQTYGVERTGRLTTKEINYGLLLASKEGKTDK